MKLTIEFKDNGDGSFLTDQHYDLDIPVTHVI
jgi:hypothetical protein